MHCFVCFEWQVMVLMVVRLVTRVLEVTSSESMKELVLDPRRYVFLEFYAAWYVTQPPSAHVEES